MEKEAARILQREKELEEEKRVKEQYLAKIRAQREQQEKEAKEKEATRKAEMERKMKALKEAADAKARAEFAEKQHAIEEEARLAREKHQIELENVQMQVEDVFGHAMQQEMIVERERQRQIAAEQDEWRLFQEREEEKQREAAQLRRAAMAQQYEQDKQRRIQIHKLQKERAAQQAERREMQNRQVLKHEDQPEKVTPDNAPAFVREESNLTTPDEENQSAVPTTVVEDKLKEDSATSTISEDNPNADSGEVTENTGGNTIKVMGNENLGETEKNVRSISAFWLSGAKSFDPNILATKNEGEIQTEVKSSSDEVQDKTACVEQGMRIVGEVSEIVKVDEVTARADIVEAKGDLLGDNENTTDTKMEKIGDPRSAADKHVNDTAMEIIVDPAKSDDVRSLGEVLHLLHKF
ncbi:Hypothetical protein PHPALM_1561 [Phytophthora palmivora]|uniref:Uncharacterized protein n=1 Tax=Phytophthora palmivora TaxID=4796 RepID=A0A2P4YRY5_9STRA|nr:Hypothetical protein PHPALM_1561 [Phytophthora palmivora]